VTSFFKFLIRIVERVALDDLPPLPPPPRTLTSWGQVLAYNGLGRRLRFRRGISDCGQISTWKEFLVVNRECVMQHYKTIAVRNGAKFKNKLWKSWFIFNLRKINIDQYRQLGLQIMV
jgi:hypothetical protein